MVSSVSSGGASRYGRGRGETIAPQSDFLGPKSDFREDAVAPRRREVQDL
jgi:hypothetical protein